MCLAIPAKIVELHDPETQLAKVEISGVRRNVNVGLVGLEHGEVAIGEWVLVHVGFALAKIDEQRALETLALLEEMGEPYREELDELRESRVE